MQEIAVRAVQLQRVDAEPLGTPGGRDEGVADTRKAGLVERGRRDLAVLVRQSRALEPLRPACASCIATAAFECLRTEARIGFSAASLASL
jgi:hypothetical protein